MVNAHLCKAFNLQVSTEIGIFHVHMLEKSAKSNHKHRHEGTKQFLTPPRRISASDSTDCPVLAAAHSPSPQLRTTREGHLQPLTGSTSCLPPAPSHRGSTLCPEVSDRKHTPSSPPRRKRNHSCLQVTAPLAEPPTPPAPTFPSQPLPANWHSGERRVKSISPLGREFRELCLQLHCPCPSDMQPLLSALCSEAR